MLLLLVFLLLVVCMCPRGMAPCIFEPSAEVFSVVVVLLRRALVAYMFHRRRAPGIFDPPAEVFRLVVVVVVLGVRCSLHVPSRNGALYLRAFR